MTSTSYFKFASPPSLWGLYPRILIARKPGLVPEGRVVPRIEARLGPVRVDPAHLRRYREICGCTDDGAELPIAYPHVLASALHLAMLASDRFPVALMGLVHVANRIEVSGRLDPAALGELFGRIEGHEETPRGQVFALHTEWATAAGALWCETSTFLARARRSPQAQDGAAGGATADDVTPRRRRASSDASRASEAQQPGPEPAFGADPAGEGDGPLSTSSFRAPAGLGRRYGQVSGDVNPIHLADVTARAFGFRGAIAHGMWSLARCAAELDASLPAEAPRVLDVQFLRPVFLPSWLSFRQGRSGDAVRFALLDSQGEKTHLTGSLRAAA
jgi:acyl dehydratase